MSSLRVVLGLLLVPACVDANLGTADPSPSIVGGVSANIADFPTVVAIETRPGQWFCTGTLIDKDWVLTAAHCLVDETATKVHVRFDDANVNDTTGGKLVAVAALHVDPTYEDALFDNDIALIKLAASVTDRTPTPIHRAALTIGTSVTEVGYGDSDNNGNGAGVLRKLVTPTADCAMAQADNTDPGAPISGDNLLCFDASDGNASCYGDSGGPAFVVGDGGGLEVAGVTSSGTADDCTGPNLWDLYTSVNAEIAFVDQFVPHDGIDPGSDDGSDGSGSGSGSGGSAGSGSGTSTGTTPGGGTTPGEPQDGDGGGCSSSGSPGLAGLLVVGAALMRRRRR